MENRHSFFTGKSLFWGFGVSLILRLANTNFWISEILGIIIGAVILLSVKEVHHNRFTKAISGFIMTVLTGSLLVNMAGTLYLRETPVSILATFTLIGAFIISMSKKKPFKKTIYILFIYSITISIIAGICLLGKARYENLLPAFYYSFKGTVYGAIVFALTIVTPILTLNDISDKKTIMINYAMSSLFILCTSLLIIMVLGNKEAVLFRYPEYIILKRIKISDFFTNVDNILFVPIVVDLMITSALGFKNIELDSKLIKYIVLALSIGFVFMACTSSNAMTIMYNYYPILLAFLLIVTLIPKK